MRAEVSSRRAIIAGTRSRTRAPPRRGPRLAPPRRRDPGALPQGRYQMLLKEYQGRQLPCRRRRQAHGNSPRATLQPPLRLPVPRRHGVLQELAEGVGRQYSDPSPQALRSAGRPSLQRDASCVRESLPKLGRAFEDSEAHDPPSRSTDVDPHNPNRRLWLLGIASAADRGSAVARSRFRQSRCADHVPPMGVRESRHHTLQDSAHRGFRVRLQSARYVALEEVGATGGAGLGEQTVSTGNRCRAASDVH